MKQDPIFKLIETHRAAHKTFDRVVGELHPIETRLWGQGIKGAAFDKHPEVIAYERKWTAANAARARAMRRLCAGWPATLAGLSALALYIVEAWNVSRVGYDLQPPDGDLLELLLRTVAATAERADAKPSGKVIPYRKAA